MRPRFQRIVDRIPSFLGTKPETEAIGGILLITATFLALVWANSPWSAAYDRLWHTQLGIDIGSWSLSMSLLHWINDGLMAVFFFAVGLEIKRELVEGQLSSRRRASLPVAAALGGIVVPAAIYLVANVNSEGIRGWGIPMATDPVFMLGLLALLGQGLPNALKVFLMTLAVVDDIGAIAVIALVYSDSVAIFPLLLGLVAFSLAVLLNRVGIRRPLPYIVLGLGLWYAALSAGIHTTVAGVLLALTIPLHGQVPHERFSLEISRIRGQSEERPSEHTRQAHRRDAKRDIHQTQRLIDSVQSPADSLEYTLRPWVTLIIPFVFALANAGIRIVDVDISTALGHPVTVGIIIGLVIGKPLGIMLFTRLAVLSGQASLPPGMSWRQVLSGGVLAGIGFTASFFISTLAFSADALLLQAKLGILVASALAGMMGWLVLRLAIRAKRRSPISS